VLQKAVRQAAKAPSFKEASEDLRELAEVSVSATHLQRLSHRVGQEWTQARDEEVQAFRENRLVCSYAAAPKAAAVMLDGGRTQIRADNCGRGVHEAGWRETKVACCLSLSSQEQSRDPQPEPPSKFLHPERVASGKPTPETPDNDPRAILAETLTYVRNNRERMDYPRYRRLGLPVSSAPVESTIKLINRRIKGSEKFWLQGGAEAMLQLRAAYLSEDDRAAAYWSRPRRYLRAAGPGRLRAAA
jgi:hypothetical protein